MQQALSINTWSLILSTGLLMVAMGIAYKEKLGLDKDILVAGVRAVIQLIVIGSILEYIFSVDHALLTIIMVLFIIFNASFNAHKRSNGISHSFIVSTVSIGLGTLTVLTILILTGVISFIPSQVVPITGMIASNAMVGVGLTYRALNVQFKDNDQQVIEKLALGATPYQASKSIIRRSIKTGMSPSIDNAKTVGLVSLPGMMSGLMFAGIAPSEAIRYQIVVMFMIISVNSLSSISASYLSYRSFFNQAQQLKL